MLISIPQCIILEYDVNDGIYDLKKFSAQDCIEEMFSQTSPFCLRGVYEKMVFG